MDAWQTVLALSLVTNALWGVAYRVFRLRRGGPRADVTGQAILGGILLVVAAGVWQGQGWGRWAALAYGIVFGVLIMPLWTLGVFIPMRPRPLDKTFALTYWAALALVVVAALLI